MWEIYLLTVLYSVGMAAIGEVAAALRCKNYSISTDITYWTQAILMLCIPVFNMLLGFVVLMLGITLPKKTLQDLMNTYG